MIKSIVTAIVMFLVVFGICYYFAPNSTTSFLHYIASLIQSGKGQGDQVVQTIQN